MNKIHKFLILLVIFGLGMQCASATTESPDSSVVPDAYKATPTVTWSNPADIIYGTALSNTQLNARATYNGNPVGGTFVYTPVSGTILSAGNAQNLHADFTPTNTNYYKTASKDVKINVSKATPTITWNDPAEITSETSLSKTQLGAEAKDSKGNSVDGTYAYTADGSPVNEGDKLSAGTHALHVDFTPDNASNYTSASKNVQITVVETPVEKLTPTITWDNPAEINTETALSATQLNAVAKVNGIEVAGTYAYTPDFGTKLSEGQQTLRVVFTPTDAATYNTASADVTINVKAAPVTPEITWENPAEITYGAALSETQLNAVAKDPKTGNKVAGTFVYNPAIGTVLGLGTRTLYADFTPDDATNYTTASKDVQITVSGNDPINNKNELQLWAFDASNLNDVPDNVFTASKDIPFKSNVSLTYNSTLGSIDSTCLHGDSGETYITGAYPTVNENLTFTMGVDSSSPWSYGYLRTSVAYIGVRHASDDSYVIESYWTSDDGSLLNSSFEIPASSVVNNMVTVSIHSYESNRSNVVTAGPGLSVITPYRTETTRKLPYTNVIQPLIFLDCYASGADGWVNVHLYNITQSIPRDIITPYARNDIMGFGLDYPNVTNNKEGTDFLISHDQNATVYVSGNNLNNPDDVAYDNSLFAEGFEEGIHFWPGLATESPEEAQATIDAQMGTAKTTFGSTPASWSSSENSDTVTHAIYAYNNYGALYRHGMMGMGYVSNVDTLSNATWAWWSEGSKHGAVCPCFTHETDNSPAIPYSIAPELFETFVTNLNSKGINLVGFSNWYYSSMAQTATTNILQSDENTTKFELNTSGGYPVNMNVKTAISPSNLDCNGVSIPFEKTSDGIQFRSAGNGTYTLTSPILPVANFTTSTTEGYAPLTVQFNDISTNSPTGWKWNFGDETNSTEQNPMHIYSVAGSYTVNLTATNGDGSSDVKSMDITVKAIPSFPGYTNPPTDFDHDDFYEDVNGNGIMDFNDVVAYYHNMNWIEGNAPVALFDYNKNNLIDFDDVVKLYKRL